MARKRSVSGRMMIQTPANKLTLQLGKVNKQLNRLQKAGLYGQYESKKLIRLANESKALTYKKGAKNKIRIKSLKGISPYEMKQIQQTFTRFGTTKLSTISGIKEVKAETMAKIKSRLGGITDKVMTDKDVEEFIMLTNNKDFSYIADKIGDSETYSILQEVVDNRYSQKDFIRLLSTFMDTNNQDLRNSARKIYNKVKAWV